ncbi:thioredoxin [mine drainage metagenome]|uniref:Thioredoxin n=1 Tax=mine drainage metagenome TaxID=410659 RepID=A0A1J5S4E7_9ZZZZ
MMAPILKELKDTMGENVKILKVDVDANPALSGTYQIQSVPTLIIFKNGLVKWRQSGVVPAKHLQQMIESLN